MIFRTGLLFPALTAVILTAVAALSFARGAELRAGDLAVTQAWARATPPGATVGAAYVTITNEGEADDRIVAVSSPAAGSVMLHQTVEVDGVATMRPLDDPSIPAGGRLEMLPGGAHLMLMELSAPLKHGDHLAVTLTFEKAGAVTIPVEVAPIGADAPAEAGHQHPM